MKPDASTLLLREKSGRIDNASVRSAYRRYAGVYNVIFGAILDPGREKEVGAVNGAPINGSPRSASAPACRCPNIGPTPK